jgi:hypothetical protein
MKEKERECERMERKATLRSEQKTAHKRFCHRTLQLERSFPGRDRLISGGYISPPLGALSMHRWCVGRPAAPLACAAPTAVLARYGYHSHPRACLAPAVLRRTGVGHGDERHTVTSLIKPLHASSFPNSHIYTLLPYSPSRPLYGKKTHVRQKATHGQERATPC